MRRVSSRLQVSIDLGKNPLKTSPPKFTSTKNSYEILGSSPKDPLTTIFQNILQELPQTPQYSNPIPNPQGAQAPKTSKSLWTPWPRTTGPWVQMGRTVMTLMQKIWISKAYIFKVLLMHSIEGYEFDPNGAYSMHPSIPQQE
jgi:hypothetical protein